MTFKAIIPETLPVKKSITSRIIAITAMNLAEAKRLLSIQIGYTQCPICISFYRKRVPLVKDTNGILTYNN